MPEPATINATADALSRLLTASEPHEPDAPPAKAYRQAMRRHGQDALAAGGPDALAYLRRQLASEKPDRAEVREAILDTAWDGLTEGQA